MHKSHIKRICFVFVVDEIMNNFVCCDDMKTNTTSETNRDRLLIYEEMMMLLAQSLSIMMEVMSMSI
jgi:hypothetical protein